MSRSPTIAQRFHSSTFSRILLPVNLSTALHNHLLLFRLYHHTHLYPAIMVKLLHYAQDIPNPLSNRTNFYKPRSLSLSTPSPDPKQQDKPWTPTLPPFLRSHRGLRKSVSESGSTLPKPPRGTRTNGAGFSAKGMLP